MILGLLFIEVSSFQVVLIRGVPAVLFIEVSSFQGGCDQRSSTTNTIWTVIGVLSITSVLIKGAPPM